MLKNTKNKGIKGITLIALVITIIVLLILAGISITMLSGDNSILKRAGDAKDNNKESGTKEQIQLQVLGSYDENAKLSLNKLKTNLQSIGATVIADNFPATAIINGLSYKIDNKGNVERQENADRAGINVGDYINFEPDTDYDEENHSKVKTYSKEYLSEKYTGNTESQFNNEDLVQETLKWQVLKKYEDGSMKLIGTSTNNGVRVSGEIGYNNFVWLLNDICEQLYSKKSVGIIARNINIEDFEDDDFYVNENKGNWKKAKEDFINEKIRERKNELENGSNFIEEVDTLNKTVTYKKDYSYYPDLYQYENGSGIDSKKVKTNGITQSDKFAINREGLYVSTDNNLKKQANNNLTTKHTNYTIDINEQNYGDAYKILKSENGYTLASRFVDCRSNYAAFGMSMIYDEQRFFIARSFSSASRIWKRK